MTTKQEVDGLIRELQIEYEQLREKEQFLLLKEDEVRQGGIYTYLGYVEAKEQLKTDRNLLTGHAGMVSETIMKKKLKIDSDTRDFLDRLSGVHRIHTIANWPVGL